ncbi:hypothetical protein CAPTEDRAFT_208449 [Capitella teleta]|uniref:Uncharacterized protein n=1 Tax=Capitella teleta TaxID=283909 RepID=R7V1I1_CAPTE|nr:hypothetical protein CAPTEDRAFT_208449 [Capitella teleta]|eukprot:ELU12683.1 hypothetical protein CAPTEDRAFT_208449 [Capitella teleta]
MGVVSIVLKGAKQDNAIVCPGHTIVHERHKGVRRVAMRAILGFSDARFAHGRSLRLKMMKSQLLWGLYERVAEEVEEEEEGEAGGGMKMDVQLSENSHNRRSTELNALVDV